LREYFIEREEIMNDIESYFTVEDNLRETIYQAHEEGCEDATVEMIEAMLRDGIPMETIVKIAGKDPEFIKHIQDSM